MRRVSLLGCLLILVACAGVPPNFGTEGDVPPGDHTEALVGFDGKTNGFVAQATFDEDRVVFEDVETVADGLGPLYNAQSCRECHQNPVTGGISQVSELRAGSRDASGQFHNARVPIARGTVYIEGRTLINERAICPSAAFPNDEIQEHVPDDANITTFRMSLNVLGDGLIEAMSDDSLRALAARQCRDTNGRICGRAIEVPILEASGVNGVGRFGWKAQQASLLSFSADAYLNEMGITNRLLPDEVTTICDTVPDPEDRPASQAIGQRVQRRAQMGLTRARVAPDFADIDHFARFIRATKAPPRDNMLANTDAARKGSGVFDSIGCATCHVRNMVTAPAGTVRNGGTYAVAPELGNRLFHPFSDFLMHDIDSGDGIEIAVIEHHGKRYAQMQRQMSPTANRIRTPPLWGLRTHSRLMHDGGSLTLRDAIERHGGEAKDARQRFSLLSDGDKDALFAFLRSL
jgi:CxxC motif-containing protein (DUF1111 family)